MKVLESPRYALFSEGIAVFAVRCVLLCLAVALFAFPGNARAETCGSNRLSNPPTDRQVLVFFYCETSGANWTRNDGWLNDNTEIRNWRGVRTNAEGRVTELDLRANNLAGRMPTQMGYLSEMSYLDLSRNQMSGECRDFWAVCQPWSVYISTEMI